MADSIVWSGNAGVPVGPAAGLTDEDIVAYFERHRLRSSIFVITGIKAASSSRRYPHPDTIQGSGAR